MQTETDLNELTIQEVISQKNRAREEAYCGALLVGLTSIASVWVGTSLLNVNAMNSLSLSLNIFLTLANISCLSAAIFFTSKQLAKKANCQRIIQKYNEIENEIRNNLTPKRIDPCSSHQHQKKSCGKIINASYRVVQENEICK